MSNPLTSSPNQSNESGGMVGRSPAHHLTAGQVWYLVHCKPNGEQMALRNLENQGFPAFLPLQKLTRRKGAAFKTQLRPLFPGYMFVAQDPTAGQWHKINNTRGVARLVRLAAEPTPLPPAIMDQLFARCDAASVFQQSATLVSGDDAKITQGPFAGAIAKIIKIDPHQRIHLLLDFMGQTSTLTIDVGGVTQTS
jgi:transcriptional antiterminator RfaH